MTRKVLLAGLGKIGMGYDLSAPPEFVLSHARAASVHPAFDLVAAVDPMLDRRELFEASYSVPSYASFELALETHRPDVVVIAGPTDQHRSMLQSLLGQWAPEAVLCEKPLGASLTDARSFVASCDRRSVALFVNYIRRSDPGVVEVKHRLESGQIKGPVKGVVWYSKGFLHSGSHFFNLLQYWLGPFEHGAAFARGRLWHGIDPELDVRVVFKGGSVVFLAAREEAYPQYTVELIADNGRLRYEQGGALIEWMPLVDGSAVDATRSLGVALNIPSGMTRYQWHVFDQLERALSLGYRFVPAATT